MTPKQSELTPAEWNIMKVVWEKKEVVAREVYEELHDSEKWATTTVRTMMERLVKKGYLKQKKIGPVYLYKPAVKQEKVMSRTLRNMVSRMTDGNFADLVAYAVKSGEISEKELKEIESLIQNNRRKDNDKSNK